MFGPVEGPLLALLVPSAIISCTGSAGRARGQDLFDARERAVVRFATLLTSHLELSSSATRTSLARICRQRRPFELVVAIATANSTNRFNDGLGAPLG